MTKKSNIALFVILISFLVLSFILNIISFQKGHEWGSDFCHYIAQSKALVHSSIDQFENFYSFIFNNSLSKPGPVFAPWGFPILLMPVYYLFGDSIVAFKIFTYLFQFFSIVFFYLLSKRFLCHTLAILLTGMIAFHPQLFDFKEIVQPDTPHLFFVMLNFWLIDLFLFERQKVRPIVFYILLGISLYFAFMIKTIGVIMTASMFAAHMIVLFREKNLNLRYLINKYVEFIPYFLFFILYVLEKVFLPGSHSTYSFNYEHSLSKTVFSNFIVYLRTLYEFLSLFNNENSYLRILNFSFSMLSVLFVIFAIKKSIKRTFHLLIYILLSFCILLPLPFNGGGFRYLLPVLFLYMILFFIGIQQFFLQYKSKINFVERFQFAKYLIFLLIIPWFIQTSVNCFNNVSNRSIIDGPYKPESVEMFSFIKEQVLDNESVIFFKPRAMNFYTNKYSFRIIDPRKELDEAFFHNLELLDWNYLVLLKAQMNSDTYQLNKYNLVFSNKDFIIYRNKF